jgi:Domian of unknown function (DUF4952)
MIITPLLRQILIVSLLTLSWQLLPIEQAHTPPICENFLAKWGKQPPQLNFAGCRLEPNIQSDRAIALYTVKGTEAKSIEGFLQTNFQMAPLKFLCCGWEPISVPGSDRRYGGYRVQSSYHYQIAMGSGETLERNWQRIPTFHVWVTKFMREI